ncbi:MAG: hypothetical protein U0T73_09000 [Chitinophagales bacterium]
MKNFNTKNILAAAAAFLFINTVSANTYTVVSSGKWNDASIWENGNPGNEIAEGDVVIVKNHITVSADVEVKGSLVVEKGFSIMSNRTLHIASTGTLVNNGNVTFKRLYNEGKINNNNVMESMLDIENRGKFTNNASAVAGTNLLNFGGAIQGTKGTYFANSTVVASGDATFGNDIKIYHSGEQAIGTETAMKLEADVINHNVMLAVENPNKETATTFTIERSFDGKNYTVISEVKGSESNVAMIYQDKNIDSELVHYKVKVNGSTYLPQATVKMAGTASASIR